MQGRADDHSHQCDCVLSPAGAAAKHDFEAAFPTEIYAIHEKSIRGGAFMKSKPEEPQAC
jgi:hypothetical protein